MILLQQMMVLFVIMLIGYLCRKVGVFGENTGKRLSGIVVNIANPALILSSVAGKEAAIEGRELLFTMGLAMGTFAVLLLLAELLPRLLRVPKKDYGVYKVMTVFSNIGFMGFPLLTAMYGSQSLLYASLFLIPFNVLIYTYGISALAPKEEREQGGARALEAPNSQRDKKVSWVGKIPWKKIFNLGVIACIVAMVLYVTKLPIPQVVADVADMLGSLTAPLSMMVIGDAMSRMKFKELFQDWKLLAFTACKLLLIPIAGLSVIKGFSLEPTLNGVLLVMLATPVGSMTTMLAQQYDGNYELASKGVALSTLFAVVTMPFISLIMGI